jgi:hypothetical protein
MNTFQIFIMADLCSLGQAHGINWEMLKIQAMFDIESCLRASPEFMEASTIREQCHHACRLLRDEHVPVVPYSVIRRLLQMNKGDIIFHCKQYKALGEMAGRNGRPPLLSTDQHEAIVAYLTDAYERGIPCTLHDISRFIEAEFHVALDHNTIHHLIDRDPRIRSIRGVPMEDKRVEVSPEAVIRYLADLAGVIQGMPAHFVFNMDEMGHQEWADRQERTCYVPASVPGDQVPIPISGCSKRITLLACIGADGSHLKPLVVIPRKTVDADLLLTGLTSEKVSVASQPKGFINTALFEKWLTEICIPEIVSRRRAHSYEGPVALILDNCSAHRGALLDQLCMENRIVLCFLPPHSSNQLQPLDLSVFGITKRRLARVNRMEALNIQSDHIAQVVCAFMAAAIPINVVGSFKNAGIALLNDEGSLLCYVNPEAIRCLLHPLHPALPGMSTDEEDEPDEDPDYAVTPEEEEAGALEEIETREYLRACRGAWRRRGQGA